MMKEPDSLLLAVAWLLAGLGLFLYGVELLSGGLRTAAGEKLRRLMARTTRVPLIGLAVGTLATALLQSSNAMTVLVVSFVDAGLLTLAQSVGLVFGSSIGATVTTQLLTIPWIDVAALPAIGIGLLFHLFARRRGARCAGEILLGFGMLFFGFTLMKGSVAHWQDTTLRSWFAYLAEPSPLTTGLAVLTGALATAVVQSGAATIGIIMVLASQGVIQDLHAAIPLAIGCNIGATITAVLASLGATVTARRAALLHVLFRVLGGLVSLALLHAYVWLIPGTAASPAHQVANFHTLSNLLNSLLFLPFGGLLVRFLNWAVRGKDDLTPAPRFIDFGRRSPPEIAYRQARDETLRLAAMTRTMTADALTGMERNDDRLLELVLKRERVVDVLHGAVTEFVISTEQAERLAGGGLDFVRLLQVLHHIERVGDHAENLVEITRLKMAGVAPLDDRLLAEIRGMGHLVDDMAAEAISCIETRRADGVARLRDMARRMKAKAQDTVSGCYQRVREEDISPLTAALFEDTVANLASSASHLRKAAEAIVGAPAAAGGDDGEESESIAPGHGISEPGTGPAMGPRSAPVSP